MFLISSDYERADWKDMIREQQKKCKQPCQQMAVKNTLLMSFHMRSVSDTGHCIVRQALRVCL